MNGYRKNDAMATPGNSVPDKIGTTKPLIDWIERHEALIIELHATIHYLEDRMGYLLQPIPADGAAPICAQSSYVPDRMNELDRGIEAAINDIRAIKERLLV